MKNLALLLPCALCAAAVAPCLWDHDTLAQERARFPTALELITGRFPRHSEAYWRWRIEDRTARMEGGESTPELYDDLAVAHEKLGDHERAIALMNEKEALFPGLYETAANHGTFLVHAGQLEEGADEIARAIRIDPDAHFGREVYQELLVRYVLARRTENDAALPLEPAPVRGLHGEPRGFWGHVHDAREVIDEHRTAEIALAAKGVLGMLRFGNHDSPVLLEALADVLLADWDGDAKRLAARALLKASYEVDDEDARRAYRVKAASALGMQTPTPDESRSMKLDELEPTLQRELREAEVWYAELEATEAAWIAEGENVDARFAETYLRPVETAPSHAPVAGRTGPSNLVLLGLAALAAVLVGAWVRVRTRSPLRRRTTADRPS